MSKKTVEYSAKNIEKILSRRANLNYFKRQEASGYDYTYDILLEYFECLMKQRDKKKWLIGGTSLAYSWMPKILEFRVGHDIGNEKRALSSLCEIHKHKDKYFDQDDEIIIKQLKPLKDFVNNAIVGPSKLLHFSYPTVFPIWDSLVKKAFSKETKTRKRTKTTDREIRHYIEYARSVHEICADYKDLVRSLDVIPVLAKKKPLRKIEYALFLVGRRYREQEKKKRDAEKKKKSS